MRRKYLQLLARRLHHGSMVSRRHTGIDAHLGHHAINSEALLCLDVRRINAIKVSDLNSLLVRCQIERRLVMLIKTGISDDIQQAIDIPLLHIADATAQRIKTSGIKKIGLLGTRFTMEEDFYRMRLQEKHGFAVIIPDEEERQTIHSILYSELCMGEIKKNSKEIFQKIIENLVARGAEGVILGCTEIPLLVKQEDYEIPLFDTTTIHARAAVEYALRE